METRKIQTRRLLKASFFCALEVKLLVETTIKTQITRSFFELKNIFNL